MLAMEIAITDQFRGVGPYVGIAFFAVALYFAWRSFYMMRIRKEDDAPADDGDRLRSAS